MRHLGIGLIVLGFLFISELVFAQPAERVVNWDFSSGVVGTITFREGNAWNEFDFERNEWTDTETTASNGNALHCRDNKPYYGKDVLGIGQYHGRGQSIIPCPEAGVEYTLSASGRVAEALGGEDPGQVALFFYDNSAAKLDSVILTFSNTTYTQSSQTFNIPSNTVWTTLWIRKSETIDFYVDWVSLQATVDDTPAAVTGFTATELGSTRIKLAWNAVANAQGYMIERKYSSETDTKYKTIFITLDNGSATSFLDTRESGLKILEPGTSYTYRIRAVGDYGNSTVTTVVASTASQTNSPGNTTYYIDATAGDDAAAGTSEATAWKSFLNVDKRILAAGDQVLLKKGEVWTDPLHIHGSGASGNIILVGSYGSGSQKPQINVGGHAHAAIRLFDVSYCKVENLELSNFHQFFRELFKFGIRAGTWQNASATDLEFNNIYINKIRGSALRGGNLGAITNGELCAGIRVGTDIRGSDPTGRTISNVTITNCTMIDVEQHGIQLGEYIDGLTVSNNNINRAGYIGMLTKEINNGTIENNYILNCGIYMTMADNAAFDLYYGSNIVIQNNVVYNVYNERSGQSLNLDGCDDFIVQYNFFKSSDMGTFVVNHAAARNKFRYNISEDFNGEWMRNLGGVDTEIYNNTAYVLASNVSSDGYFVYNGQAVDTNTPATNTTVKNNLFVRQTNSSQETGDLIFEHATTTGSVFSNNAFFGNFSDPVAEDSNPFTADPVLTNPGSGTVDEVNYTFNADGYQLQNTSPYLTAGLIIANNGGLDFWGNSLPSTEPSIGSHYLEVILPIEFIRFDAKEYFGQVQLLWETAWEKDNMGFEIQHSTNGTDWNLLSFSMGAGTKQEIRQYTYNHLNPSLGTNYYRLKQIDLGDSDGMHGVFSEVKEVYIAEGATSLQIYPNPTQGVLHVNLSKNGLSKVQIFDLTGKLKLEQEIIGTDATIDLSAFPK